MRQSTKPKVFYLKRGIDLINMQINGLKQRVKVTLGIVKQDRYAQGIEALEEKLDELLFNSTNEITKLNYLLCNL